ncbi:hypothetical protein GZH53_07795 [Flavihumibacter sp. R14]|nr:hypothetical protein [Flavihumibacter soli]
MKRLIFSVSTLILVFVWIYFTAATDYNPAINTIIGDISYVKKFGHLPSPGTDRDLRIQTHLAYAEMLLRESQYEHQDQQTRLNREQLLDYLNDYWKAGIFPDYPKSGSDISPCLVDNQGRVSAIGYLVSKAGGGDLTEKINKEFYDSDKLGHDPVLNAWSLRNGFTREELAIIQPAFN